ncbi:MAG: double-strand break repair helicase AddA, partial [Hyphomicrobiaceae bacterium]
DNSARNQARAADPGSSVWVSANAGTGKTHVLTLRVLRLLLSGAPPERILALTYTKAAAAEMSTRVFNTLAGWATADASVLRDALTALLGREPEPGETALARRLFARAIETPGGLKVQTIHAFCERLLQRFPLEAGVSAGFSILDDEMRAQLLREATDAVLSVAIADRTSPLGRALQTAIAFAADAGFDAVLAEALSRRDLLAGVHRFDHRGRHGFDALEALYRDALRLPPDLRAREANAQLAASTPDDELQRFVPALAAGSASDVAAAQNVRTALAATSDAGRIAGLAAWFLTAAGEPRRTLATRRVLDAQPWMDLASRAAQERFIQRREVRNKVVVVEAIVALLRLADGVLQRYGELKARHAALDFDDLIDKSVALLGGQPGVTAASDWVLYKLDGGLDHVLVDEAQDTSSSQWAVIRALAMEFFAGQGARGEVRTLFAVGDEKQSIYGFQGAAPKMFADMGERFEQLAQQAGLVLHRMPLTVSFRSVEPVLDAVDLVFADRTRTPGLTADETSPVRHIAHRIGHAGLIEIWPTERPDDAAAASPWLPLADESRGDPVARLADRIARTIRRWLDEGEILQSENRPIRAGDILILVRKRQPFAPAMVTALKKLGIPVAGADRLALADEIAVQDLMVLGDFLTLPEDDLALATILKSPFFDLDDDDLLAIAPGRKGTLWSRLLEQAGMDARFAPAAESLKRWRAQADYMPPFEFYAALLDRDGLRRRLLGRLGPEASDPVDEFLNLALNYDETAAPSLTGFLAWIRSGRREVKRDMDQGRNEVRVMTVHGAKGLEAPVVFLPDTCSTRSGAIGIGLLDFEIELPVGLAQPVLWPVKGMSGLECVRDARAAAARRETEERNRLLYVALTRARDRLYVSGFEGVQQRPADCWYNLITVALADRMVPATAADGGIVSRWQTQQSVAPTSPRVSDVQSGTAAPLPEWANRPAPREQRLTMPLAPSRLAPLETDNEGEVVERPRGKLAEPPALTPAALADANRFLRGTLTHALLEHLPGLPQATWEHAAAAFVARRGPGLSERTRRSIAFETLAVLRNPAFGAVFGPDSVAEVPIVAEIPNPSRRGPALRLTGQIDRLVRLGNSVLIVDYKTNRPPPRSPEDVADAYLFQLAAYRLAVGRIFHEMEIRCAILWTDGPRIMEIPGERIDEYQQQLWALGSAGLDALDA